MISSEKPFCLPMRAWFWMSCR